MKTVHLSKAVSLPVELTTRRSAVFGISGSGKSNTATVAVEGLLAAGEQVVLVDPKGEGWGLQTTANGKAAAFDVIVFGQPRGDIPELKEEHAEQIADFVVDSGRSVVLSLLGFDSDASERRFVTRFFQRLYRRKSQQSAKTRTLVVLEEAHLFVPEQGTGAVADMVGAIKRIARQGRSAGLGLMIVDQRPQDVAKSIISQCELLICHQLTHKLDRAALQDWVRAYDREGQGEAFLESLAELQPGEAWVWSPGWLHVFVRTKVDRRATYDSGATPSGTSAEAPKARAKVDLDALRTHLAKVVEQAKADDPKELRKEIAALKAELAKRPTETKVETKEVRVEVPVLKNGQLDKALSLVERLAKVVEPITQAVGRVNAPAPHLSKPPAKSIPLVRPRLTSPTQERPRFDKQQTTAPSGDLTSRQQRFLDAAATLATLGVEVSRETVSAWVGVHPRGGSVGEELKALADAGMIELDRGRITVTDAGAAAANHIDAGEAIERAKAGLSNRQRQFFEVIVEAYPGDVTREQIAEHFNLHPRGGSLGEDLGRLVGRGLVEGGRGRYRAREFLFAGAAK